MLKRVLMLTCLAVLVGAVATAQTPPPTETDQQKPSSQPQKPAYPPDKPSTTPDRPATPPDQPTPGRSTEARGERSMTLTGCLQRATEGGGFILTNATSAATGTSGTTMPGETGAPATAALSYRLVGTGGQDLSKHVGHKVQIAGSLAGRAAGPTGTTGAVPPADPSVPPPGERPSTDPGTPPSTTPPSTTPPSSAASPMAPGKSDMPRLNVRSMTHVADTCPQ